LAFTLFSCEEDKNYLPKPYGFSRISLPEPAYQTLEADYPFMRYFSKGIPKQSLLSEFTNRLPEKYPYTFEYSRHAVIRPDSSAQREPYWIELYYPELKATVHLTTKFVGDRQEAFEDYVNDAHTLVTKHGVRLQNIAESTDSTANGLGRRIYQLEGDVPTTFQCVVTDTSYNFFRAALYVPYSDKNDSIAPILDYVRNDIMHLSSTLKFRDIGQYKSLP
ncbi:MAG: hypothetical protein AAF740_15285, partial [Bacteroidota bacterium]